MPSQFATVLKNCHRMFPSSRTSASRPPRAQCRQSFLPEGALFAMAPIELDRKAVRLTPVIGEAGAPVCPIIRAQSEVVGTMLRAVILASGGSVENPQDRC
jgi:hypothetical protein